MIGLEVYGSDWQWSNSGEIVSFGVSPECADEYLEYGAIYVAATIPFYYNICNMHFFVCEYEI